MMTDEPGSPQVGDERDAQPSRLARLDTLGTTVAGLNDQPIRVRPPFPQQDGSGTHGFQVGTHTNG